MVVESSQKALKLGLDRYLNATKIITESNLGVFEFKNNIKMKKNS